MHPERQLEVLEQCPAAKLVALDTMRDFIVSHRATLQQLLQRSDLLFANEAELRALLPTAPADSIQAAREALMRWQLQAVILKLGARGALAVFASSEVHSPPFPGPAVVDPTGAGDALAGGLLGRLAQLRRHDDVAITLALTDGSAAARQAISAFGVDGLLESCG
jgi:sugar/nucleoside kinase (ribokinase family)